MKESFTDRIRRKIRDFRIRICHYVIKKAVRRLDVLRDFAFLEYSWGFDEEINYHVIKERSTMEFHQFGTKVEHYDKRIVEAGMGEF